MASYMLWSGILLTELTGVQEDHFSVFGGSICNVDDLQAEAFYSKDAYSIYELHVLKCLVAFWNGDYISAEVHSHNASAMMPVSQTPTTCLVHRIFFGGLVAFQMFRQAGGEQRLQEGKETMERMGKWADVSMAVFDNKGMLLSAEYSACIGENDTAEQFYKASIMAAGDHGNIHELALAYELLGNYYAARELGTNSIECYHNAYKYYNQWGATAVAEKLFHKHNLGMQSAATASGMGLDIGNPKRSR